MNISITNKTTRSISADVFSTNANTLPALSTLQYNPDPNYSTIAPNTVGESWPLGVENVVVPIWITPTAHQDADAAILLDSTGKILDKSISAKSLAISNPTGVSFVVSEKSNKMMFIIIGVASGVLLLLLILLIVMMSRKSN